MKDSALEFFNRCIEIPETLSTDLALPVQKYQVWAIKTHDSKYAKVLILNTIAYDDSSTASQYGEAEFDWVYQPNDSRTL